MRNDEHTDRNDEDYNPFPFFANAPKAVRYTETLA